MKRKYMIWNEYCEETGYPVRAMKRLLHSYLADRFSFRPSEGKTAPHYIRVNVFESMEAAGEFKGVLEG